MLDPSFRLILIRVKRLFKTRDIEEQRASPLFKRRLVEQAIHKRIGEALHARLRIRKLECEPRPPLNVLRLAVGSTLIEIAADFGRLLFQQLDTRKEVTERLINDVLAHYRRRAVLGVAAVVHVSFLTLSGQGALAKLAPEQTAKREVVALHLADGLAGEDALHTVIEGNAHQR